VTLPLLRPMLAVPAEPFSGKEWLFEIKWDGYRCLCYLESDATVLRSRNLLDLTPRFPELSRLHERVRRLPAILDGEIIVPVDGRPSFSAIQQRGHAGDPARAARAAAEMPALFIAFDALYLDGRDITREPVEERKERLAEAVAAGPEITVPGFVTGEGKAFFRASTEANLEGVMGKRLGSPYLPGRRSSCWRKIRAVRSADLVICGWEPGQGARRLGALILGAYRGGRLVFQGKAGTGFSAAEEAALLETLRGIEVPEAAFDPPKGYLRRPHWVAPFLVCTVRYTSLTGEGLLRHPSFKGLRWDKRPEECGPPEKQ